MQVIEEVKEFIISEPQAAVLGCRKKMILEMAGQGSGKSQDIGFASGQKIQQFPKAKGFIGANTKEQLSTSTLTRVFAVWKRVYEFTQYKPGENEEGDFVVGVKPPLHFERYEVFPRYEGIISFKNGATVFYGSLTKYKTHDGKEFAWAHLDETKDTVKEAITDVILGRLRQKGLYFDEGKVMHFDDEITDEEAVARGWTAWNPLYIHTSPPMDGLPWLNEMFSLFTFEKEIDECTSKKEKDFFYKEAGDFGIVIYPTDFNRRNLPAGHIEGLRRIFGKRKAKKLVDGNPFGAGGGEWLPNFDRHMHTGKVEFIKGLPVWQIWDFNVLPYMTCLCMQIDEVMRYIDPAGRKYAEPTPETRPILVYQVRFYKEYCLEPDDNKTESVCEAFKADHGPEVEVFITGDSNGRSRIPGLGSLTNYKIILQCMAAYIHNQSLQTPLANAGVFARRDFLDDILKGVKYPEIEIIIDVDNCPKTIHDLSFVKTGKKGKFKKKVENPITGEQYEEVGHTGDCVEYGICTTFIEYMKKTT